jgi:hypothetical protein
MNLLELRRLVDKAQADAIDRGLALTEVPVTGFYVPGGAYYDVSNVTTSEATQEVADRMGYEQGTFHLEVWVD